MTRDNKHTEEVMSENLEKTKGRKDPVAISAEQHRQSAEWLKELRIKAVKRANRWGDN